MYKNNMMNYHSVNEPFLCFIKLNQAAVEGPDTETPFSVSPNWWKELKEKVQANQTSSKVINNAGSFYKMKFSLEITLSCDYVVFDLLR